MNSLADKFEKRADMLQKKLFGKAGSDRFKDFCGAFGCCAAFISVSDKNEQAYVFRASGKTAEDAWKKAKSNAIEFINTENFDPVWVKADVTFKGEKKSLNDVLQSLSKVYPKFFRKGISFDEKLEKALIEAELNTASLINYKAKKISLTELNKYLAANDLNTLTQLPEEVVLFTCKSAFCDENGKVYELYSDSKNCGRRKSAKFNKETALGVITSAAEYLSMQVGMDGGFDYGFYPTVPKLIPGYNILRHASSIWSLLCAYRITGDKFTLENAECAIGFMIRNMAYKYPNRENNVLYLVEGTKKEVKIGGNAVAIVVLTEYMSVTGSDKYVKIAAELGNGILELFDERSGGFFHVLNFPSFSPRDKFRTVYYDGECVFALSRVYGLTKDKRYLDAAAKAADRFIEKNYEQYADHWVAYSINELTKYLPEEKYFNFGIKNVQTNLERIYKQPTTYHTFLELLCVSFELVDRIKAEKRKCAALEDFDVSELVKTIFYRAEYMLNGYCYPEYVMYFANPSSCEGAFFIRHDNYRMRIDDVQHFCCAYYSLYRNYEKLDAIREQSVKK